MLFGLFVFRIPRNYSVYKRIAIIVFAIVPLPEFFRKFPKVDIFTYALFEFVGVIVYEFHGHKIYPAETSVETLEQKLREFCGISYMLESVIFVFRVKTYSRLGGV